MFYKFLFALLVVGVVANAVYEDFRVINGTNAEEGEFPFAASLRDEEGHHTCGSSILNEKWILTAAHCVSLNRDKPFTFNIQYGVTVISENDYHVANIEKIIVHENYSSMNHVNDIALLLLKEPLKFSDKVKPVDLPKQSFEVPKDSKSTLVGWGQEKSRGVGEEHLHKVDLLIFSDEDCNKLLNGQTHHSNICAGVPEGGKGQCSGDSGGPLIVNGEQLGIVSWSKKPCTIPPYPGVYTKVSHFVNWIWKKLTVNSS